MPAISFIDFVFPQFSSMNWRLGVGIYRAGGISNFHGPRELISARIRAGIGEIYDVRMKLHTQGKCVQWMECTCQAYRRHNEKCQHLAAFCIYLDQDKSETLRRMNLSAGESDKYLYGRPEREETTPPPTTGKKAGNEPHLVVEPAAASAFETDEPPPLAWRQQAQEVLQADISEQEPLLLLTVLIRDSKKITYCLGVDDAIRALALPEVQARFSAKLNRFYTVGHTARRFFDVANGGPSSLKITRCIGLTPKGEDREKNIPLEKIAASQIGRTGFFTKQLGYVPFVDNMSPQQVARWNEYPSAAVLEGDTAAMLFENNFARMNDTAEVRVPDEFSSIVIASKVAFDQVKLRSTADGKLVVDTNTINNGTLLAIIRARSEGKKFLSTKTGWVKLDANIDWLKDKIGEDGKLKLTPIEFIKFREQFASESEIIGNGAFVERIRTGLVSSESLDMPSLAHTNLNLRPYQEEGVKWLWWLYQNGFSGLLADEMGLGKTHQAMGLISTIAKEEPQRLTLVVCPTSVIDHWLDKLRRFVPGIDAICYHGSSRRVESLRAVSGHRVIITSYGITLRDLDIFVEKPWSLVILDEAHLVKNQASRTYRATCRIPSRMRLCLTGTPLENDLMELKNLFDYLLPSYLGSDSEFKNKYLKTEEHNALTDLELHRLIHPFKMRRNKVDVLVDLPEKVEDLRHCHLRKEQHRLYSEALALKGAALVETLRTGGGPIPYIHVFSVITLLKQICNDPALVDPRYETVGSGKLDVLDELIEEALASDQKVVVFSQYAKMINRLSQRFALRGWSHVCLTGSTTKRGEVIKDFQENPDTKIFLGSLLAGGAGIDLTAASVVIHFDRWWNAAKENQATDRIHRIGQVRNVQVYKLITKGTLEERIDEIINRKRMVFERFIEQDADVFKHLTRDELLSLLAQPVDNGVVDVEIEEQALANAIEEIPLG
jgi:superfamily II DNA or RNA helicase